MDFHAHVYYDPAHRQDALLLQQNIQTRCQDLGDHIKVYPLVDRLVGPHLMPMFEIEFSASLYDALISYLQAHHGELPVLIHPLTPDEIANHGRLARWLGQQLPLNWSRLTGAA